MENNKEYKEKIKQDNLEEFLTDVGSYIVYYTNSQVKLDKERAVEKISLDEYDASSVNNTKTLKERMMGSSAHNNVDCSDEDLWSLVDIIKGKIGDEELTSRGSEVLYEALESFNWTHTSLRLGSIKSSEEYVSFFYSEDSKVVRVTQIMQEFISADLKSLLTEKYSWIYDYVRNVASDSELSELVKNMRDSGLNYSSKKDIKALDTLLDPMKARINVNQMKYGLHVPFFFDSKSNPEIFKDMSELSGKSVEEVKELTSINPKQKDGTIYTLGFEKAPGGMPDVISITKRGSDYKINFTAANSLTTLSMESDQIERHSSMIALARYLTDQDVKNSKGSFQDLFHKNYNKVVNDSDLTKNNRAQRKLYGACARDNEGQSGQSYNFDGEDINLKELYKCWDDVNINFFQTYSSNAVNNSVVAASSKAKGIEISESFRQTNEKVRALLSNSQNRENDNTMIGLSTKPKTPIKHYAQNDNSLPLERKNTEESISEFNADILNIKDIGKHLNHLTSIDLSEKKRSRGYIEYKNQFASGTETGKLEYFLSPDESGKYNEGQVELINEVIGRSSGFKNPNNLPIPLKISDINPSQEPQLNLVGYLKSNIGKFGDYIKEEDADNNIHPLLTPDDSYEYTTTDLAIITMLGSNDVLRTSALLNMSDLYLDEIKSSSNQEDIKRHIKNIEMLLEYSSRILNNLGQGDSKRLVINTKEVRAMEERNKALNEKTARLIVKAFKYNDIQGFIDDKDFSREDLVSYMKDNNTPNAKEILDSLEKDTPKEPVIEAKIDNDEDLRKSILEDLEKPRGKVNEYDRTETYHIPEILSPVKKASYPMISFEEYLGELTNNPEINTSGKTPEELTKLILEQLIEISKKDEDMIDERKIIAICGYLKVDPNSVGLSTTKPIQTDNPPSRGQENNIGGGMKM